MSSRTVHAISPEILTAQAEIAARHAMLIEQGRKFKEHLQTVPTALIEEREQANAAYLESKAMLVQLVDSNASGQYLRQAEKQADDACRRQARSNVAICQFLGLAALSEEWEVHETMPYHDLETLPSRIK